MTTEGSEPTELATEMAMEVGDDGASGTEWHRSVAFTTLVIAVLAASAALLAGITSHEILIDRTEEIVDIAIAQGDLARAQTAMATHELLNALGVTPDPDDVARAEELRSEADAFLERALEADREASFAGSLHLVFSVAATIFAVAIAITGLSAIVDRRWLWATGVAIAGAGLIILSVGLIAFFT